MLEPTRLYLRPIKALGQNFLVNSSIAEAEAEHSAGKNVLELGSGYGILTRELCKRANRVVSVELDKNLSAIIKHELKGGNLKLVNKDFFEASEEELELKDTDIMISNVPYRLSSRVMEFLLEHRLQAVLCLQKEFVQHMLAEPGSRNYSKLSVFFQLCFSHTRMLAVPRGNFRPMPKVDSVIIYMKPKGPPIGESEKRVINALMQHKKKTVRNALVDSEKNLGKSRAKLDEVAASLKEREMRVFKLSPLEIHEVAKRVSIGMSSTRPVSA